MLEDRRVRNVDGRVVVQSDGGGEVVLVGHEADHVLAGHAQQISCGERDFPRRREPEPLSGSSVEGRARRRGLPNPEKEMYTRCLSLLK